MSFFSNLSGYFCNCCNITVVASHDDHEAIRNIRVQASSEEMKTLTSAAEIIGAAVEAAEIIKAAEEAAQAAVEEAIKITAIQTQSPTTTCYHLSTS